MAMADMILFLQLCWVGGEKVLSRVRGNGFRCMVYCFMIARDDDFVGFKDREGNGRCFDGTDQRGCGYGCRG